MAGRLAQTHIARHNGGKYLATEVLFHLRHHLQSQVGAAVQHGQQHALDIQRSVQPSLDACHGIHQAGYALQGIIFALDGNQHAVCRRQGIDG